MDSMAYLQQIATTGTPGGASAKKNNDLFSKIVTLKNGLILLGVIVLIFITGLIINALNVVDNKDQELLIQSWWRSTELIEAMNSYTDNVKSSDLRSLASSLKGALNEIIYSSNNLLTDEYGIEVDDLDESEIAITERTAVAEMHAILEEARLNGVLDRAFVREFTMQIAYLISYQSECSARTAEKHPAINAATTKAEANLQNLYDRFKSYQDLSN